MSFYRRYPFAENFNERFKLFSTSEDPCLLRKRSAFTESSKALIIKDNFKCRFMALLQETYTKV